MNRSRNSLAFIIVLVLALLATACAARQNYASLPLNPGAWVQINTHLDSLPNASRVYFQDGMRVTSGNRDQWRTFCELYVYDAQQNASYLTSVHAGEFKVIHVGTRYEVVDNSSQPFLAHQLAALQWHDHDPPSYVMYKTAMRLQSADQPQVQSLNCYVKASNRGNYYPDLGEIREALGSLIEIRLNSV